MFGQAYIGYKVVSKITEGVCRLAGENSEDAKLFGRIIGGSFATVLAVATFDAVGGAATASDVATEAGREAMEARMDHLRDL